MHWLFVNMDNVPRLHEMQTEVGGDTALHNN